MSSGSAAGITHCVTSRFVSHHKYAELREWEIPLVQWESRVSLAPGAQRVRLSQKSYKTFLVPELCSIQIWHVLQVTSEGRATGPYWNFSNPRLQWDILYLRCGDSTAPCPRFLTLVYTSAFRLCVFDCIFTQQHMMLEQCKWFSLILTAHMSVTRRWKLFTTRAGRVLLACLFITRFQVAMRHTALSLEIIMLVATMSTGGASFVCPITSNFLTYHWGKALCNKLQMSQWKCSSSYGKQSDSQRPSIEPQAFARLLLCAVRLHDSGFTGAGGEEECRLCLWVMTALVVSAWIKG